MSHQRRLGLACGIAALLLILLAPPAPAETPALLVADLVPSQVSASSFPSPVATLGGVAYFTAEDTLHGRELWRTEGTPETTLLVADLCPGSCPSFPKAAVVGNQLFVYANTGDGGALFTSDGTAAGTRLVHRFVDAVSMSSTIVAFDDRAWFVLIDSQPYAYRLWQSDGTGAGTAPWPVDCGAGCQPTSAFLAAAGDELFFGVTTVTGDGYRLWRTDGTVAGTRSAEPDCPPSCVTLYAPVGVAGGHYYFTGADAAHGAEVWVAGGGLPAPRLVADLSPGANSSTMRFGFAFAGEAWFQVTSSGTVRWYRFTPEGAEVATEVEPPGPRNAAEVWPVGDRLFFAVADPPTTSLWTVKPGIEAPRLLVSGLRSVVRAGEVNGLALMQAFPAEIEPSRLLVSDGTVAGTHGIAGVSPLPNFNLPSVALSRGLLFGGNDDVHGSEPWISDGTAAGTRALGDLRQDAVSSPSQLTAVGDEVAFVVNGNAGHDLYAAGAAPGAPPAIRRLLAGGYVNELVSSGGKLFASYLPPSGSGPWSLLAIEPKSGATSSNATGEPTFHLTPWRGGVAFGEYDVDEPLWTSDGTAAGTHKVLDLFPGYSPYCPILCPSQSFYPTEMTPLGDRLYFVAIDSTGDNLWTSDGTAAETVPLVLPANASYGLAGQLTPFDGGVAFWHYGDSPIAGPGATEIWASRGTVESTRPLLAVSGETQLLGTVGGKLVFSRRTAGADSVWGTDGTSGGTTLLHDLGGAALHPRVRSQRWAGPVPEPPLVVRDRVFFVVGDDAAGEELWVSDGTAAGTRRVADVRPGDLGSHPQSLAAYRGCALFAASDGVAGYEPWASDGATAWRVADVAPGAAASSPSEITPAGGFVYFTADDGTHGRETFAVATTELDARCATQPPVNPGPPPGSLTSAAAPGFAFLVKIGPAGGAITGSLAPCVAGTVCVTGTAGARGDVFVRMVPTSAGRVAPAIVKLTPAEVAVTVHQLATGAQKVYQLAATVPPSSVLDGALDRDAFATAAATSTAFEPMELRAGEPAQTAAGARWFKPRDIPGYRFKAWLVDAAGKRTATRPEGCVQGTLCLSGPLRGRTDVLVRLLDRRPAAARLTGTGLELWVERTTTGEVRKFLLPAEGTTSTSLDGVLDPVGFRR